MIKMSSFKLDKKDRKILYQLDLNSRQSYTRIGKSVGLSKEVVNYRMQRLEKSEFISSYYIIINLFKLGYQYIRLFLKYQNINSDIEKEITEYLKHVPQASWIGSQEGIWNLAIVFLVKTNEELNAIIKELFYRYGDYFSEREISPSLRISHFKQKFLHETKDYSSDIIEGPIIDSAIDEVDYSILKSLSENAREEIISIAKKTRLTPKNIIFRIRKLEDKGIILAYKPSFNLPMLGYHYFHIFLYLKNPTPEHEKKIYSYLANQMNIFYISQALGKADFEFEIALQSHNELFNFMKEFRDRFSEQVRDFLTVLIYKTHKIKYLP